MNPSENIQNLLLNTLQLATSQEPQQVKQAEHNLNSWEKEANFYPYLSSIYANTNLDESARYMSILTLKNGIDKHWRKTQTK